MGRRKGAKGQEAWPESLLQSLWDTHAWLQALGTRCVPVLCGHSSGLRMLIVAAMGLPVPGACSPLGTGPRAGAAAVPASGATGHLSWGQRKQAGYELVERALARPRSVEKRT